MPTNIDELLAMEAKATGGHWYRSGNFIGTYEGAYVVARDMADDDRGFIQALRNAAPDLLAELRETRAALAAWMAAKEARKAFWRDHADDLILHGGDEALALDDAIDAAEDVLRGIGERICNQP